MSRASRSNRTVWWFFGIALIVLGVGLATLNHGVLGDRVPAAGDVPAGADDAGEAGETRRDSIIRSRLRDAMAALVAGCGVVIIVVERRGRAMERPVV